MCGIAGVITNNTPVEAPEHHEINILLDMMVYRGPDASHKAQPARHVLLGGNRLRITDHDNYRADLPMRSHDGRLTITYNGEIYNHQMLRRQLSDYDFVTQSDTETILAAYDKWGVDCVHELEGMFAFCIYDRANDLCMLARDPVGQKPLYYYRDPQSLIFCSEIDPLIQNTRRFKSWNRKALQEYIAQRMILGEDTHINEIKKLEAGCLMTVTPDGNQFIKRYYTAPVVNQTHNDIAAITEDLARQIEQACSRTFALEVPYGHLLSGGIDSTGVLAHAKAHNLDLRSYAIGFEPFEGENFGINIAFNEFEHSRFVADFYQTSHTEIRLSAEDYCSYIDQWADIMGEPLDSSEAPCLYKLFETMREQNERIVFSGSGPDELFDGYGLGPQLADSTADTICKDYYDRFAWNFSVDMNRLMPGNTTREYVTSKYERFLQPYRAYTNEPLQLAQLINLHGRMVDYEFRQMDVLSMRHSIEARAPLANRPVLDNAFSFAPALKQYHGEDKWIYKQAFRGQLPDRIIDREKEGFPTPIECWFTSAYEDRVRTILDSKSALSALGIIDQHYLSRIWHQRHPEYRCIDYRLYCLERLLARQAPYVDDSLSNAQHAITKAG
jgi:asparagine synthase (glutamine-hydrolysing)